MGAFFDDCKSGKLPSYSFIEPRWFDFLEWMENSEHPGMEKYLRSGDVRYGEMLLKSIYEVCIDFQLHSGVLTRLGSESQSCLERNAFVRNL